MMIFKNKLLMGAAAVVMLVAATVFVSGTLSRQTASASSGQGVWLARNVGEAGDTVGFDVTAKRAQFILPKGLRSADGSAYWAAFHAGETTALHAFDVNDGSIAATIGLEGTWDLGAVSATGKWLALKREASDSEKVTWAKTLSWKTEVAVIDATTGRTTRTLSLNGNFDVDALDSKGSRLYVIEHLPANKPDHYQVRAFDLIGGSMLEGVLADKRNLDEVMAGYPTDAVAAANGEWLFTVYVGMQEGHAFIHALNLENGFAWCIDLPSGDGDPAMLENYALAVAPDGHTIYASNAVLGLLAYADVNNIGEPTVVRFAPAVEKFVAIGAPVKSSVVTPDGKHVYVSNGGVVWEYDVAAKKAQEVMRGQMPIVGMGWSVDAKALVWAGADHTLAMLGSGTNVSSTQTVSASDNAVCPITRAPETLFVPPAAYPAKAPHGEFWYGNKTLWTALGPEGVWSALPYYGGAFSQKVFWWSDGYVPSANAQPAIKVTGKQLDGNGTFTAKNSTNANHSDFGGWGILTGVEIPARGCWEVTGEFKGETLRFVVQVGK